jgi:hypothetical protein
LFSSGFFVVYLGEPKRKKMEHNQQNEPKVTLEALPNGETMRHVEMPSGNAFSYIGLGCIPANQPDATRVTSNHTSIPPHYNVHGHMSLENGKQFKVIYSDTTREVAILFEIIKND